jgi:hypothetical protein
MIDKLAPIHQSGKKPCDRRVIRPIFALPRAPAHRKFGRINENRKPDPNFFQ